MKELKWVIDSIDVDRRQIEDHQVTVKLRLDDPGTVSIWDLYNLKSDLQKKLDELNYTDTDAIRDMPSLYPRMFIMPGRCNGKTMMLNAWIKEQLNAIYGPGNKFHTTPNIKDVIFNDPATIVLWADGTKTVVKTQDGDEYDPEKGLAMAISKKALGNKHEYYNVFKKWLKKWVKPKRIPDITVNANVSTAFNNLANTVRETREKIVELNLVSQHAKLVEDCHRLEKVAGHPIQVLEKLFAAGYELTPPNKSKSIMDDPTLKP